MPLLFAFTNKRFSQDVANIKYSVNNKSAH